MTVKVIDRTVNGLNESEIIVNVVNGTVNVFNKTANKTFNVNVDKPVKVVNKTIKVANKNINLYIRP